MFKRFGTLAVSLAVLAILAVAGCGGDDSSDSSEPSGWSGASGYSSEWSDSDRAALEEEVTSTSLPLSEEQFTCYIEGAMATFPPSVVGQTTGSEEEQEQLAGLLEECGLEKQGVLSTEP